MDGLIKVLGGGEDIKPCTSLELKKNYKVGTYFTSEVTFCVKEAREDSDEPGTYTYRVEIDDMTPEKLISAPKDSAKKTTDEQDVEKGLKSVEAPEEEDNTDDEEGDY